MPKIRLDNAVYLLIIAILTVCLWFCKIEISILQTDISAMKDDLRGSMIYKFPEKQEFDIPEDVN
jgi:hypothetical protein